LSPYLRIAFPNEPEEYLDYLDLQALTPAELESWQSRLRIFLQSLTLSTSKRLILKSPTHTARIAVLARMFPGAKFLHIVRNPLAIFPSTINLWQVLDEAQGLQLPHHRGLRSYVFRAFERMYRAFDQQRTQIAPSQLYELRYEDLVRDPISTLRQAYAALELGEFDAVQPKLAVMTAAQSRYQTNRFELPAEESAEILARWKSYAERYGYAESSAKAAAGGVR